MIKDIIENLNIDFQKAITDNYRLKDGLYVRVRKNVEYFIYKALNDNSNEIGLKDLEGNIRANEYEWFIKRDYLSNLQTMDKYIHNKKIHSNNYLATFVKAKEWKTENIEYIKNHFEVFKNFEKFEKKEEKRELENFKKYIDSEIREKDINIKFKTIRNIFNNILRIINEKLKLNKTQKDKFYIKIFFDEPIEKYEEESKIYFALKIYNKINTTRIIDSKVYGQSDFNFSLNQKKPYNLHKTRGFEYPFMIDKDEIFKHKEFFDFLKYQQNEIKTKPSKHKSGIFLAKYSNNDQAEITDFDILVYSDEISEIVYKDYIQNDETVIEKIRDTYRLFKVVDEVFYNKNLENNLRGEVYSKLPNELQNLIYLTREGIGALLKNEIEPLLKINKKFGFDFVEYYLRQDRLSKAKECLNLYLSLKEAKGEKMDIVKTLEEIEKKIINLESLNEDEFFILAGQIIYYLLSQSEKSDKKADMYEPFLRAGKVKKLKQEIETLFFTYKHKIPLNFKKFKNNFNYALALVEAFKGEKVKRDKLLIGILTPNIFYKKDEK